MTVLNDCSYAGFVKNKGLLKVYRVLSAPRVPPALHSKVELVIDLIHNGFVVVLSDKALIHFLAYSKFKVGSLQNIKFKIGSLQNIFIFIV